MRFLFFNIVKLFLRRGSLVVRLSMCIHIHGCTDLEQCAGPWLLQRHQSCWPWPLTSTHPAPTPLSNTHRQREREREMHPTLELVYTQRICNYSVCLKCPKFLCKMEHLNRHHASAPATNCSARQSQTEFLNFISIRLVVCVFSIYSFFGGSQFWPLAYLCGLEWPHSIIGFALTLQEKNNNFLLNDFPLQPLALQLHSSKITRELGMDNNPYLNVFVWYKGGHLYALNWFSFLATAEFKHVCVCTLVKGSQSVTDT